MAEKRKTGRLQAARQELKKLSWPTRKQTIQYTVTVIIFAAIVAVFCWTLDIIFGWLVGLVL